MSENDYPDKYFELLDAGYSPPDAARMAGAKPQFSRRQPDRYVMRAPATQAEREANERDRAQRGQPRVEVSQDERDAQYRARKAANWVVWWKTWPRNYGHVEHQQAYFAALAVARADKNISPYKLAQAAIGAVVPKRASGKGA